MYYIFYVASGAAQCAKTNDVSWSAFRNTKKVPSEGLADNLTLLTWRHTRGSMNRYINTALRVASKDE